VVDAALVGAVGLHATVGDARDDASKHAGGLRDDAFQRERAAYVTAENERLPQPEKPLLFEAVAATAAPNRAERQREGAWPDTGAAKISWLAVVTPLLGATGSLLNALAGDMGMAAAFAAGAVLTAFLPLIWRSGPLHARRCESCRQAPSTLEVRFTDGAVFAVCARCAQFPAGPATTSATNHSSTVEAGDR
jgi:hypothetical protein